MVDHGIEGDFVCVKLQLLITNNVLSIGVSVSVSSEEDGFSGETSIFENLQETHNERKLSND